MASEIRVNKIENRSGLGTVTFADTGVDLAGIVTATTFSGSGASLTSLPAAQLTGALPAISGASLTGMASTDNVRTGILDVAGISTFRNTMNVGAAVTISESGIEASGIGITVANINGGAIGGRRNIIINGAMQVAQRGTSATSVSGEYKTVDRLSVSFSGEDEDPTEAQHTLTSSDTGPYAEGFRKSFHLTNGNQTSGAGAGDYLQPQYKIEAQDIANSGWDYTSSSSYITISFWAKSSVAGDYTFNLDTQDGTGYRYLMEYTLVADTWKKITKTIPGNSNLTVNNDTGLGLQIMWYPFLGSNYVQADQENNWYASSNGKYGTTSTTNWWTTNDSTWEITGVQLEVGSQATPFEHRTIGDELQLCKRYYQLWVEGSNQFVCFGDFYTGTQTDGGVQLPVEMRSTPSIEANTGSNYYIIYTNATQSYIDGDLTIFRAHKRAVLWYAAADTARTAGHSNRWVTSNSNAKIAFNAEL